MEVGRLRVLAKPAGSMVCTLASCNLIGPHCLKAKEMERLAASEMHVVPK